MSATTVDPRDDFEKVFPMPSHVIRCGNGYACTEYNAWGAHNFIRQWEGWSAAMLQGADEKPELTVWYGSMPETNGKANWTAILHRKGECLSTGITIEISEYPDRVRYEADRVRHIIGELKEEPDILAYDADAHSGYVEPVSQRYKLPEVIDENLVEGLRLLQCMLDDYRERNYGHAQEWMRHINTKFSEYSEAHEDDAYSIFGGLLQCADGNSPVIPDGWVLVPVDMAPEQMRAVQISSELGSYAASNLTGACSLFREFWDVAIAAALQQEVKP